MRQVPAHRGSRARNLLSRSLTTQANKIAPCKVIQDGLGFWILRRGSWISNSLSVELTFRILVVMGIPGYLSWIPGSKAQDSIIPRANISRIRESLRTFISPGDKNPEIENIKPKTSFDHPCHLQSGIPPPPPPPPLRLPLWGGNDH